MRFLRLITVGVLIFSLFTASSIGYAEELHDHNDDHISEEDEKALLELQQQSQLEENLLFLKRLEDEYSYSRSSFNQVSQTLEDAKAKLRDIYSESVNLKEQLFYLDKVIETTEKKLMAIEKQLVKKNNRIEILEDKIIEQEDLYLKQRKFMADYISLLYIQERNYFDAQNDELEAFRFLLSNRNASQVANEAKYFEILHKSADELVKKMERNEEEMRENKSDLQLERLTIAQLTGALRSEKRQLDAQKQAKLNLLDETKGSQEIFQNVLDRAKEEQDEARKELLTLKGNLDTIRRQITKLGDNFDPEEYENLLNSSSREVYEFYLSAANNGNVSKMAWPVLPKPERGLSAYFRDESYRAWAGIPHNAIDIPTPQETIIRAPLDCVVWKNKDNGFGYSYSILACKGGYMLTFGHVVEFLREEGEKVHVGEEIALSGGMPGTKGAGYLTTGPHLHFEVMKDGKYKDPLDFLDISLLPYETLPDKYKKRLKDKVQRKKRSEGLVLE